MEIYFNIQPRQSGKTTKILRNLYKANNSSIVIGLNRHNITNMKEMYNDMFYKITANVFFPYHETNKIRGCRKINDVYIDEYLFFTDKRQFKKDFDRLIPNIEGDIYIFTTADKLYSEKAIEFVKYCKKYNINVFDDCLYQFGIKSYNEYIELYDNFLTEPNTHIIHHEKQYLSDVQFETEILGKIFK